MSTKTKDWSKFSFDGILDTEKVVYVSRLHPVVMRSGLVISMALMGFGAIPFLVFPSNRSLLILFIIGILLSIIAMFIKWIRWNYTLLVLTNRRFIMFNQKGLFSNSVVDAGLDKIQSVNYQVNGIEESILSYGTLVLQTVSGDLVIKYTQKPKDFHAIISNTVKESVGKEID